MKTGRIAVVALVVCALMGNFGVAVYAKTGETEVDRLVRKVVKTYWPEDYEQGLTGARSSGSSKTLPAPSADKIIAGLRKLDELGLILVEPGAFSVNCDFGCRSGVMSVEDYHKLFGELHSHDLVGHICHLNELKDGKVDCMYVDLVSWLSARFAYESATKTWGDRFAPGSAEKSASDFADTIIQEEYLTNPFYKNGESLRKRMYDRLLPLLQAYHNP